MAKEVDQAVEGRVVSEEVAAQRSEVGSESKTKPGKKAGKMEHLPSNEFAENDKAKF